MTTYSGSSYRFTSQWWLVLRSIMLQPDMSRSSEFGIYQSQHNDLIMQGRCMQNSAALNPIFLVADCYLMANLPNWVSHEDGIICRSQVRSYFWEPHLLFATWVKSEHRRLVPFLPPGISFAHCILRCESLTREIVSTWPLAIFRLWQVKWMLRLSERKGSLWRIC